MHKIKLSFFIVFSVTIIAIGIYVNSGWEYIESDNLCGNQPLFLGEDKNSKYLVTFDKNNLVCYKEINNTTAYITVGKELITLFDVNKEPINSFDKTSHDITNASVQFSESAISLDDGVYTYTYTYGATEHTGQFEAKNLKFDLIDVN